MNREDEKKFLGRANSLLKEANDDSMCECGHRWHAHEMKQFQGRCWAEDCPCVLFETEEEYDCQIHGTGIGKMCPRC